MALPRASVRCLALSAHLSLRRASSRSPALCGASGAPLAPLDMPLAPLSRLMWACRPEMTSTPGPHWQGKGSCAAKARLSFARDARKGLTASTCRCRAALQVSGSTMLMWGCCHIQINEGELDHAQARRQQGWGLIATYLEVAGLALTAGDQRAGSPELCEVPVPIRHAPQASCKL